MKFLKIILLTSFYFASSVAQSGSGTSFEHSLNELLSNYSKTNDIEFVIDPSVKGKAIIEGIKEENLNAVILASILEVHGYSAIEKNGKVHVLPDAMAEGLLEGGGMRLGSQ